MLHTYRVVLLFCAPLAISGCAGSPTTYLTLRAVPPEKTVTVASKQPIAVSHPSIPPDIDRAHFTVQTGPSTMHVAGNTVWVAPLGGMIQLTLAQNLAARLPNTQVLMPGDLMPPSGARQVRVNILHFMPARAGQVSLQANWSILSPSGQIQGKGHAQFSLNGGATPADEAHTMSLALARLAAQIAEQL